MGGPRLSWTQPMCEACWIDRESEWRDPTQQEIDSLDLELNAKLLVSVRQPSRVKPDEDERHVDAEGINQCAFCGAPTIVGIFVRQDPATVKYPRREGE